MALLHMRIEGQSRDLELDALNLNPQSSDSEVKTAVANLLDKDVSKLMNFVVVRNGDNITLRPEAVFG